VSLPRSLGPVLLVAVAVAGGCGGGGSARTAPLLPGSLARSLAAQADDVGRLLEAGDGCSAHARALALQRAVIGAINERRVPVVYQEQLLGAVNLLLDRIRCSQSPAAAATSAGTTAAATAPTHRPPGPSPHVPPGLARKGGDGSPHDGDHGHPHGHGGTDG
jgi:hypothetical protein